MDQMVVISRMDCITQGRDLLLLRKPCHILRSLLLSLSIQVPSAFSCLIAPERMRQSIDRYNIDIIPLPTVGLRSSASLFPTPSDRDQARQGLESLNREAAESSSTSNRLQETLKDLRKLLQEPGIPLLYVCYLESC
jgi:hypothetical protein